MRNKNDVRILHAHHFYIVFLAIVAFIVFLTLFIFSPFLYFITNNVTIGYFMECSFYVISIFILLSNITLFVSRHIDVSLSIFDGYHNGKYWLIIHELISIFLYLITSILLTCSLVFVMSDLKNIIIRLNVVLMSFIFYIFAFISQYLLLEIFGMGYFLPFKISVTGANAFASYAEYLLNNKDPLGLLCLLLSLEGWENYMLFKKVDLNNNLLNKIKDKIEIMDKVEKIPFDLVKDFASKLKKCLIRFFTCYYSRIF
ncbi:MAG: hypothetical protein NDF54_08195 [archaeon GB-1867-035]|nr:hypothetical protein [Candidatus Culexmicrobium profundum]